MSIGIGIAGAGTVGGSLVRALDVVAEVGAVFRVESDES